MLRAMAHANALQRISYTFLPLAGVHAAIGQGQLHIFINRKVADQIEALKDETNLAIANARALGHREVFNGLLIKHVFAIAWRIEQAEYRQQGRLPTA